ncbi:MAG: SoxR reducing system RseC family protein [Aquisalimonadaceae bacterium]
MIEEEGVVVTRVDADRAVVETLRGHSCGVCKASGGCGSAVLQRLVGRGRSQVRVSVPRALPIQAGDRVILALDEGVLLRAAVALYGAPLAGLFVGALSAAWLQGLISGTADWPVAAGAAFGLAGGFLWVRRFTTRVANNSRYQPVIVRRVGNTVTGSVVLSREAVRPCG